MSIVIDGTIIIIGFICIIIGYKRGLTGSILKILSFILSLAIAIILYKPISNIVKDKTRLDEIVKENIQKILEKDEFNENNIEGNNNEISKENLKKKFKNATSELKQDIIINLSNMIINILMGIVVFILAKIILSIVELFIKQIVKFPIIHQIDKLGGILYGGFEWGIIIYTTLTLLYIISLAYNNQWITENINNTIIAKILYKNNFLLKILFK